jgi:hypothetical protein
VFTEPHCVITEKFPLFLLVFDLTHELFSYTAQAMTSELIALSRILLEKLTLN